MRLPHNLLHSPYFVFSNSSELLSAIEGFVESSEIDEIKRLCEINLPPVTSKEVLGAMLGINPGIIWSFQFRTPRHYRIFTIKSGTKVRTIQAPKIGLKIFQTWISHQLQKKYNAPLHVFGFVPGRSHLDAAAVHCGARWVYSIDIKDFFQTTPHVLINQEMVNIGYSEQSASLISALCCLRGYLSQGAPSSPLLSNMTFAAVDQKLKNLAGRFSLCLSRYADDIVFSGKMDFPADLPSALNEIFSCCNWKISEKKTTFSSLPNRLKIHGLLVHGDRPRLTKGYRNRVRAFEHMLEKHAIREEDYKRIRGHVEYKRHVDEKIYKLDINSEINNSQADN